MPDGSGPVELALLPQAPDRAFRAFVRFPPGWSRPVAGHYAAAEEVLVIEGAIGLNGIDLKKGDYAWVPELSPRTDLRSPGGALVFAWFSVAPRWIAGPSRGERPTYVHAASGKLLEAPHQSWLIETSDGRETLDLATLHWRLDEPVRSSGRFFVRRF